MLCRRFKPLSVRKMEITEHCQAEKEQSSKAQGGIGKATDLLISEEGISFYGHHAGQIGVNGKTIFGIMYNMREIKEEDFEAVAKFEIEISEISFGEKAITDLEFHCKKLAKAKDRRGMIVIEDTESGKIVGWVWMEKKQNSLTGEVYANFKSI